MMNGMKSPGGLVGPVMRARLDATGIQKQLLLLLQLR